MTTAPIHDVYQCIDDFADEAVRDLQALLRQPSVSAQGVGPEECASLLREILVADGFAQARIMPVEDGPPIVFATCQASGPAPTLLCYGHYDVQPPEPLERWASPPFAAEIRGEVIYARGATDNKSGVLAFVKAAKAFVQARGAPPLNLIFLFEGEEEVGSPHLERWVIDHDALLACDASIGLDGGVHETSLRPEVQLGIKAILYVELRVHSHRADFWSGRAQLLGATSASWRLVHALNSLFDSRGVIQVEGWFDDWEPPDDDDMTYLGQEAAIFDREALAAQLGVRGFPFETDVELLKAIHYGASCNICGLQAGYTGPGSKTIVPAEALAKLDFRCPPNLDPDRQLAKLRTHLDHHGFDDVEVVVCTARRNPYKTPVREAISQAVIRAAERVFGAQPVVMGVSTQGLVKLYVPHPAVLSGFGAPDNNLHAPNENMPISRYIQGIKYAATIMAEYAAAPL